MGRERERERERDVCAKPSQSHRQNTLYLAPKFLIEGTGYHASLKENNNSLPVPLGKFKVQVVSPCLQLNPLQRLHVKVRPLELGIKFQNWTYTEQTP